PAPCALARDHVLVRVFVAARANAGPLARGGDPRRPPPSSWHAGARRGRPRPVAVSLRLVLQDISGARDMNGLPEHQKGPLLESSIVRIERAGAEIGGRAGDVRAGDVRAGDARAGAVRAGNART